MYGQSGIIQNRRQAEVPRCGRIACQLIGLEQKTLDWRGTCLGECVRIATYNLWNTRIRWPERLDAACEELAHLDADVVALQEVAARIKEGDERDAARYLADTCDYDHVATRLYADDPDEGLAFLSKLPLRAVEAGWDTGLPALESYGQSRSPHCVCGSTMSRRSGPTSSRRSGAKSMGRVKRNR